MNIGLEMRIITILEFKGTTRPKFYRGPAQGGTKRAAVAAPLPGNFSEKTLLVGNFT